MRATGAGLVLWETRAVALADASLRMAISCSHTAGSRVALAGRCALGGVEPGPH